MSSSLNWALEGLWDSPSSKRVRHCHTAASSPGDKHSTGRCEQGQHWHNSLCPRYSGLRALPGIAACPNNTCSSTPAAPWGNAGGIIPPREYLAHICTEHTAGKVTFPDESWAVWEFQLVHWKRARNSRTPIHLPARNLPVDLVRLKTKSSLGKTRV